MTKDFFWDAIERKTKVGSVVDKGKEEGTGMLASDGAWYNVACKSEDERPVMEDDLLEDDDDDLASICSSVGSIGSIGCTGVLSDEDEPADRSWEDETNTTTKETVGAALKHLGNIKKKPMSPLILKDLLGKDGKHCVRNIQSKHEKTQRRQKRKIGMIYGSCKYFDEESSRRMSLLQDSVAKSGNECHEGTAYDWMDEYRTLMETIED